jgi:hypothetical protein
MHLGNARVNTDAPDLTHQRTGRGKSVPNTLASFDHFA